MEAMGLILGDPGNRFPWSPWFYYTSVSCRILYLTLLLMQSEWSIWKINLNYLFASNLRSVCVMFPWIACV